MSELKIPDDLKPRYKLAKVQLAILPPIDDDLNERFSGIRYQCEEVIQLIERLTALEAENAALKAPVSDTAFDLLKRIVEKLHIALPKLDSFVVLEVVRSGDSNIYDGPSLEQELKEADALIAARAKEIS